VKRIALLLLATAVSQAQSAAEVRGSVVDARGGEALSNVAVQLAGGSYRATTDSAGRFRIPAVAAGDYELHVSTVGYHLLKKSFHLDAGETKDFEVILSPETFRQTDSVEVQTSPFESARQDSRPRRCWAATTRRISPACWRTIRCAPYRGCQA
jgi:hypothetical protein